MTLRFEPVTLDGNYGDDEGALVFRAGALLAIACRLGPDHGVAEGQWFVEKCFGGSCDVPIESFEDQAALEAWLTARSK